MNISISIIITMGCCQSKLLNIQSNSDKYEAGPSLVQPGFNLNKKQMVQINLASPLHNEQSCSVFTLRSGLSKIVNLFEQQSGPIALNFNNNEEQSKTAHNTTHQKSKTNNKQQNVQKIIKSKDNIQHNVSQLNTQSVATSQQNNQISQFYQNNTKILSFASISSKRQLQKQLFYINSNKIGNAMLMKWSEQGRFGVDFQEGMFVEVMKQIQSNFVTALLMTVLYQNKTKINLLSFKQLKSGFGMRVFINGIKRMLKIQQPNPQNLAPKKICETLITQLPTIKNTNLCYCCHVLTGWIPQIINLTHFENTKQIFQRLVKNFNTHSLIIGFLNNQQNQVLLLKDIYQQKQTVVLLEINSKQGVYGVQVQYSWQKIIKNYPIVQILWNPFIYVFNKKLQAINSMQQQQNKQHPTIKTLKRGKTKFAIKIPPSKSQVQIRILIQIHEINQPLKNNFQINLYESDFKYLNFQNNHTPIRTSRSISPYYLSEIFIFQKSGEQNQYIFMVQFLGDEGEGERNMEDIQLTIDIFTFFSIQAKLIQLPDLLNTVTVMSEIKQQNAGFGMNSPFFNRNLMYALTIQSGTICKIQAKSNTMQDAAFQICVLPDKLKLKDLTLIKPYELSRQAIQSQQFLKSGSLQFVAHHQNYIIVIVGFTPTSGILQLNIQSYTIRDQKCTNTKKQLEVEQIFFQPNFLRQFTFSWQIQSPGPRKRTKNNSEPIFHPIKTFSKFFQNPHIDYYLSDGIYQFSVASKTFQSQYKICQQNYEEICEQIYNAVPPSLSLAIFQLNDKKQKAKIILDDYQYVPYGIGFWTQPFKLQGVYRFVFTKMQKRAQTGTFKIRKLHDCD